MSKQHLRIERTKRPLQKFLILILLLIVILIAPSTPAADFPAIYNTEPESIPFLKPAEALALVKSPPGFNVTMFANEPMIQQPIDIKTDARGRIWICENYTYSERAKNFDTTLRDRVVILEDTDHDGRADKRTVFYDEAIRLTSVFPGFGGAFILAPPQLLFVPDRDANDIPDAEPTVLLDGFDASAVRHNIANGLKLGPDGWLYGRHGILATSKVGPPNTPPDQRLAFNAAIWRYHPVTKKFEIVCEGTTNPWGNDWDENGQHFFINTVIGHLWHVIPGAYYKRMYGEHTNPYLYELIDQTADHFHWDTRETWSDIRQLGVTATTGQRGGGHAHSGFLIYNGDNWPAQYRNTALTVNYHGKRLNNDRIERAGATYTAKHLPDPIQFGDPWFRGIELTTGPDGAVYVADWSDIGECHDETGIHRTSGRIYKIAYGERRLGDPKPWKGDLRTEDLSGLYSMQRSPNQWFVEKSRQVLQERAIADKELYLKINRFVVSDDSGLNNPASQKRLFLRMLWANYVSGIDQEGIRFFPDDEHYSSWAIQLLVDQGSPSQKTVQEFIHLAKTNTSGLVLTHLASAMRKADGAQKFELANALAVRTELANDRVYPLMVWYGIQPVILDDISRSVQLAESSKLPKIRQFIARRFFQELPKDRRPADEISKLLSTERPTDFQIDLLTGMREGLAGIKSAPAPANWSADALESSRNDRIRFLAVCINSIFGNADSINALKTLAARKDFPDRAAAIETLVQIRAENISPILSVALLDPKFSELAIRSLGTLGEEQTPELILTRYHELPAKSKIEAINVLTARPTFASDLLEAVQRGAIRRNEINAAQLRQLRAHNDLKSKIATIWPQLDESPSGKKKLFEKYKTLLTPKASTPHVVPSRDLRDGSPSIAEGRKIFQQACATCHILYGEGAKIGPELTGADRANLDYWLDNIIDPSGVVPENYRLTNLTLKDDRALTGVVLSETDGAITFQTISEKLTLQKSEIEKRQPSALSMMPEGLLDPLTNEQVTQLFAYLMSPAPPK